MEVRSGVLFNGMQYSIDIVATMTGLDFILCMYINVQKILITILCMHISCDSKNAIP